MLIACGSGAETVVRPEFVILAAPSPTVLSVSVVSSGRAKFGPLPCFRNPLLTFRVEFLTPLPPLTAFTGRMGSPPVPWDYIIPTLPLRFKGLGVFHIPCDTSGWLWTYTSLITVSRLECRSPCHHLTVHRAAVVPSPTTSAKPTTWSSIKNQSIQTTRVAPSPASHTLWSG